MLHLEALCQASKPIVGKSIICLTSHSSASNDRIKGNKEPQFIRIECGKDISSALNLRPQCIQEYGLIKSTQKSRYVRSSTMQDSSNWTESRFYLTNCCLHCLCIGDIGSKVLEMDVGSSHSVQIG